MAFCRFCGNEFEPRKQGRPQEHCPGGKCRRAAEAEARKLGREALRKAACQGLGGAIVPRGPRLTEEERVRRAKDRAADALAAYNQKRRIELGLASPVIDEQSKSTKDGDLSECREAVGRYDMRNGDAQIQELHPY